MNRIQPAAKPIPEKPPASFSIESGIFARPSPDSTRVMFTPLHYESNYAYPLLVWLHAPGENDERQLLRIMPLVSLRNYVAIAPRGFACNGGEFPSGYGWPQTQDHIAEAEHRVFQCIDEARQKCRIAANRIFLAGFDAGGTMAFRIVVNHPDRFAGVLSLCGPFPTGHNPLGHFNGVRKLPVFMAVGRDSQVYSPDRACENLRLFHTAGITVALRQYPCGHQLTQQMLRDVDRWIIEQITS
jgi:phospholipase/carboxylesterase